ncbi:Arp8p [Cyberlindnera jadinii NRRL Y-1542]|uniref:Actin-like ATPase domain-containing protein n=1 Tax=Cyberlindnera jadinii (strain ATCC 18201 / CBS 1600 / BCRC 20928 / JCM 3617 / NBRC 0987 / NRRL Y-1542) TaxID=983966 RepID=A0A1E4S0T9_CYBJN|nr:actin-like ATPase domain-containing protein [Cyberlindnera jadinii NRRL Y-1542]ODV73109.1 actin-like ATPase domain-containing protein [Cyberlindnera jadinii NRRL Y-1542]
MSDTPVPSSPTESPRDSPVPSAKKKQQSNANSSAASKKISAEALERRRAGRIKAAETMAAKIKKSGIERRDNKVKYSVFENVSVINQKNYFTDYLKKDDQVYVLRERKLLRQSVMAANKANKQGTSTPALDDDEEEDQDDEEDSVIDERAGQRTVVIHPGSKNIRIGLASDVYPKSFPFVLGIPGKPEPNPLTTHELDETEQEEYDTNRKLLTRDFKERMKYYKRRVIPNSNEITSNFNKKVKPEIIPEHNDVHKVEFIKPGKDTKYLIGEDALRMDSPDYKLRYPLLTNGRFNENAYNSFQENIGEIQLFLSQVLEKSFEITAVKQYKTVLIVPDLYDRIYVESFIALLLQMGFQGVAVIQESLAATYGAGVSSACVIDIGAQTTKVSCIDEGLVIPDSRAVVQYGGDDITRLFYKLLKEAQFPASMDENFPFEWTEMEQLKEKFITFQDANITVQLYNFMKRYPNKLSEKYEFKVFDEVILSPLALFFPKCFNKLKDWKDHRLSKSQSFDIYTCEPDNPKSLTQLNVLDESLYADDDDKEVLDKLIQQLNPDAGADSDYPTMAPLEKLIIQSITNACRSLEDFTKSKVFYSNLLIVGGSSKIEALDFVLTDRINIWRPKLLALQQLPDFLKQVEQLINDFNKTNEMSKLTTEEEIEPLQKKIDTLVERELTKFLDNVNASLSPVEVLPAPRDIDPSVLTWKGGSVFARLKLIEELWVTETDWDLLGSRVLQHKTLWNY